MASVLPSPDAPGTLQHPLFGVEMATYLGACPCGCGKPAVVYEDGSLCLLQTVLFRDDPVSFLLKLAQARQPSSLAGYVQRIRLDPAEFLLVRDMLEPEQWSILFSMVKSEVLALCLMARRDREQFESLSLLDNHAHTSYPFDPQFIRLLDQTVGEYADKVKHELIGRGFFLRVTDLVIWSPLKFLWRSSLRGYDLGNFFHSQRHLSADAFALAVTMFEPVPFALLHMARFNPQEFEALKQSLPWIPDPDQPDEGKAGYVQAIELQVNSILTDYLRARIDLLSGVSLWETYTEDDFRSLFKLE